IKSFMGYPLGGEGVIVIDSKKKWVFTDKEKRILGNFASAIREEIEKEKRYLEAEEKIEELNTGKRIFTLFNDLLCARISVKEILKECVHMSLGDVAFIGIEHNKDLKIYEIYGLEEQNFLSRRCKNCIATMVLEGGRELLLPYDSGFLREKPLFFSEEHIKTRQFFGFPLIMDDIAFGLFGVASLSENILKDRAISTLRDISTFFSLYYSSLLTKNAYERIKNFEPVTGALYFSKFLRILEETIKKEKRICVASIRLKVVDAINRNLGIAFTDMFLNKVYNAIRQCLGNNVIVTRKSGGHFYALVDINERLNTKNALMVLNKIISKNLADEKRFEVEHIVDSGISFYPEDAKNIWELLNRADNTKI
ncbi:MAG TPA: diguanylate cyclase, partial [Syntrophorhabdaceae bacterium]|nr:diguanylate cyclase [Syntrophorhabdaceae bacterium]